MFKATKLFAVFVLPNIGHISIMEFINLSMTKHELLKILIY